MSAGVWWHSNFEIETVLNERALAVEMHETLPPLMPNHSAATAFGSASATMSNMIRFNSKSLGV